ncbi:hypothetical protein C8F01DRAFT_1162708 [Mycena amicta]|nr:hypothetical protein C8F01DRAFT_1162708 [Mycena amicta]
MPDADSKGKGKERVIPVPDDPSNPYLVRITTHGKITAFVTFALQFLRCKYENIPIVFHTMPAPKDNAKAAGAGAGDAGKGSSSKPKSKSKSSKSDTTGVSSISPSALLTPRLISVVEIVKREYLKALAGEVGRLTGLYQYNEVGILEELPHPEYAARTGEDAAGEEGDPEKVRAQAIATMLGGKNHIQTKQTPYMKITLSRVEIPGFKQNAKATSQEPLKRKLSKSAKTRAKRREKKLALGVDGEGEMQVQDGSESE